MAVTGPDVPLVLVAGAASRDLTADDSRGWRLGGAVTYGSLTLARLGLRVRAVLGLDAAASTAAELRELASAGVALDLVPLASGPVFENLELDGRRRQRCLAASDPLSPPATPDRDPAPDAVLLAPVADELPDGWLAAVPPGAAVALGLQGLLRELRVGSAVRQLAPRPSAFLGRAGLVALSRDDLPRGVGVETVARLAALGTTIVVTDGPAGGAAWQAVEAGDPATPTGRYRAIHADQVIDPTGAGDVFLAALFACRLVPALVGGGEAVRGAWPRLAGQLRFAAAAASLAIEGPGIDGVADRDAVRRRAARAWSRAKRCVNADSRRGRGRPNQA